MGSPTGTSSGGCDTAPLALLEESATSKAAAAAGALSPTTHLCLGIGPGLHTKSKGIRQQNSEWDSNHSTGYLTPTTDPPLPHSRPRLLRTTGTGFRPRTPFTRKRLNSSLLPLQQLSKRNSIIRVRTRQRLRDSGIQIRPIVMRPQMSTRHHVAQPTNFRQWRSTPIDQQIVLQKTQSQPKCKRTVQKHPMLQNFTYFGRLFT